MMGTNYYVQTEMEDKCETCGHVSGGKELHIGKSSCGWAFLLNIHPEHGINGFADWIVYLRDRKGAIRDEYDRPHTFSQMIRTIVNRTHPRGLKWAGDTDPDRWKRGEGTWDVSREHVDFS